MCVDIEEVEIDIHIAIHLLIQTSCDLAVALSTATPGDDINSY